MKAFITKASNDNFCKPFSCNCIEGINNLIKQYGRIIIKENTFWKGDSIKQIKYCFDLTSDKLAKWISESDYQITIYDDYVE